MKQTSAILLSSLFLLAACNGGGKSSSPKAVQNLQPQEEPVLVPATPPAPPAPPVPPIDRPDIDAGIDGQYLAVFETTNESITYKITGAFTFSREKAIDEVVGDVRLTNGGADLLHSQYIRLGDRCPTLADDTNGDKIIDAVEGEAVYGKIYIPLDGDLTSQSSHDGVFPVGDRYGNYTYSEVAKFSDFVKDLRTEDPTQTYVKLLPEEPLDIEGKVVVVHGVHDAVALPPTVRSADRFAPFQTLPIACGVIKKVILPPGTIDDGTYPQEVPEVPAETETPEVI